MPHPFARRTLASLKKDARRWLTALAAGEPEARARLRRILPDAPDAPTLRDVQLALAREQGFDGWTALKRALEPDPARSAATLAQYDDMAEALLDAYRTGTPEAMERHYRYTWHRRAWSGMRSYVQLDLGKRPSEPDGDVAISLDDARWLVARERGFDSWEALRASVANLPGGAPHVTTVAQSKALALREAIERGDATPSISAACATSPTPTSSRSGAWPGSNASTCRARRSPTPGSRTCAAARRSAR